MAILVARDIGKAWADRPVLVSCDLSVDAGERVGLVGRNGCGKSTLLGILGGRTAPDHGELRLPGSVALLEQDPALAGDTVDDVVRGAVRWHGALVRDYERATAEGRLGEATALQDQLDLRGWEVDHRADAILDRLGAPGREARLSHLSGGERRRVALALVLLEEPALLLLDEPTNHLDADTIEWLQGYLLGYRGAVLMVTHDRYLLEAVAERIVEVDDGRCTSTDGSYTDYLIVSAERRARAEQSRDRRLRLIATEAAWASRSPSARTTKQRARLQRLDALREGVPEISERELAFEFATGVPRGTTLLEAWGVRKSFGPRRLVHDVDLALMPGDRVGILGPNGAGKTTLLRMILGEVAPDAGRVTLGPKARLGLLDQARSGLDPDQTLFEVAGAGNDRIQVGEAWVFVHAWLGYFGFDRTMLHQKVASLSGGERARLLLARLMLQGATVLLLDEPTNDLDLDTLRVLEDALLGFDGAAVVVTHDRAFLDRVCTAVLAFEGDGRVVRYASRQQAARAREEAAARRAAPAPASERREARKERKGLSYKERQELDGLPDRIEALEAERAAVEARLSDPASYRDPTVDPAGLARELDGLPARIDALYARWEELSARA